MIIYYITILKILFQQSKRTAKCQAWKIPAPKIHQNNLPKRVINYSLIEKSFKNKSSLNLWFIFSFSRILCTITPISNFSAPLVTLRSDALRSTNPTSFSRSKAKFKNSQKWSKNIHHRNFENIYLKYQKISFYRAPIQGWNKRHRSVYERSCRGNGLFFIFLKKILSIIPERYFLEYNFRW